MFLFGILVLLFGIILILSLPSRSGDLFSPQKFIPMFTAIINLPFLLFLYFDPYLLPYDLYYMADDRLLLSLTVAKYCILLVIFLSAHWVGATIMSPRQKIGLGYGLEIPSIGRYLFFTYAIGVAIFLWKFISSGGFDFLLYNLQSRAEVVQGGAVITTIMYFCLVIPVFHFSVSHFKKRKGVASLLVLISLTLITGFLLSAFGGRKNFLLLIIFMIFGYNYLARPIKKINFPMVISSIVALFYVLAVGVLRKKNAILTYQDDWALFWGDLFESISDLVQTTSYAPTQLFIVDYFGRSSYWWFSPYKIFYQKFGGSSAPIDDGVYIRSLASGYSVSPPQSFSGLFPSSWPPETFGFAFASAGLLGVVILGFMLGIVHGFFYRKMIYLKNYYVTPIIYAFVLLNFQFSVLRLVQFGLFYGVFMLFLFALLLVRRSPGRSR